MTPSVSQLQQRLHMGEDQKKDIVIVGGGHSHVHVLRAYAASPPPGCRLTVIVDTPTAVYSGMVPGYVAGQYIRDELEIDASALARRAGANVVIGRAVRVDPGRRLIEVAGCPEIPYDVASFNIGSTVAGLDLPGVREYAIPSRPIGLFVTRINEVLEGARRCERGRLFRLVVVGGGAAGVEIAFTLQHRLQGVTGSSIGVVLLDSGTQPLRGYPYSLVRRVARRAAQRGIEVRCDRAANRVEPGRVCLEGGDSIAYDALVWVTGAVSQDIFRNSGVAVDGRGFARVRSTLQFEEHDDLFGTGDCATLVDHPGLAKAGVYAVRQGTVVARNLRAALTGLPLRHYTPQRDFLSLLNLGDGRSVGAKWGFTIEGRWVMKLKDWIDRRFVRRYQLTKTRRE